MKNTLLYAVTVSVRMKSKQRANVETAARTTKARISRISEKQQRGAGSQGL